jgi:nicotinamidase-related amidase
MASIDPPLDPATTAVLSLDMQAGIVSIYAGHQDGLIARAAEVLRRSRGCGMTIVHVQVGFRPGLPEISPRNTLFSGIRNSERHQQLFQGDAGRIHSALGPEGRDIVIVKHRISAFAGTDLEMILRSNAIDTLVLFGIATSGVVLSTLLDAVDADYRVVVVKDCCIDPDAETHQVLAEKLFPKRGTVLTAEELVGQLPAC